MNLESLRPFLAVADHGGFRAASRVLGVTPSAVSQAIRQLEERLGVALFSRTTRSVRLTQAGEVLAARCRAPITELEDAFRSTESLGRRPMGLLRVNAPRIAMPIIVEPHLDAFCDAYPDVDVEVFLDDTLSDVVADGFDAGIRLGSAVEKDMVSARLTGPLRLAVVASPDYLERHGIPETPADLATHTCIRFRRPSKRTLHHWRFTVGGQDSHHSVAGRVIVNDTEAKLHCARAGLGLAYELEAACARDLEEGSLVRVLEDFTPSAAGLSLYFPERYQTMPKLRAFLSFIRSRAATDLNTPASA